MSSDTSSLRTAAVVVAAGQGLRAGQPVPKQFAKWRGKPVVRHSVEALAAAGIAPIAVAIPEGADELAASILADVPDVRVYLGSCGVMAVPLRIGGGSRLKILEALACGLPVVASRVGAEGLLLKAGEDYVQADEDTMADALVEAIRHPAQVQAMAQHARQLVLDTYDWEVLAKKLEAAWERCFETPES